MQVAAKGGGAPCGKSAGNSNQVLRFELSVDCRARRGASEHFLVFHIFKSTILEARPDHEQPPLQ